MNLISILMYFNVFFCLKNKFYNKLLLNFEIKSFVQKHKVIIFYIIYKLKSFKLFHSIFHFIHFLCLFIIHFILHFIHFLCLFILNFIQILFLFIFNFIYFLYLFFFHFIILIFIKLILIPHLSN